MFLAEPELPQSQQSRLMALTLKPFDHALLHRMPDCILLVISLFLNYLYIRITLMLSSSILSCVYMNNY